MRFYKRPSLREGSKIAAIRPDSSVVHGVYKLTNRIRIDKVFVGGDVVSPHKLKGTIRRMEWDNAEGIWCTAV